MNGARRVGWGARISTSRVMGWGAVAGRTLALLSVAALSWWYYAAHRQTSMDRYHGQVTALGWIAIALSLLATALSIRKRLAYQGTGRLSSWLGVHTYAGTVAAFAVLYHSSFQVGGLLTASLLAFFSLTAVSGVLGLWLSKNIPPLLTAIEEKPAIIEELLVTRAECLRGMLELARAGSDDFRVLVERRLLRETASWKRILRFYRNRSTVAQELPAFQKEHEADLPRLNPQDQHAVQHAAEYALRVNKMNAELLLQRVLRGWLTLHTVSTAAMFGLAAVHIFSVLYY
jgi:hypothetical protein